MSMPIDPARLDRDGVSFRDLNGNGVLDPYEDPRLPVGARVEDLISRMTIAEKAGQLFHTMMVPVEDGFYEPGPDTTDIPADAMSTEALVSAKFISHFNASPTIGPRAYAEWQNRLQGKAAATRLGIPVTLSSDPVHGFIDNPAASAPVQTFSRWPEPLGFGAAGDPDLVEQFADVVRQELRAVGISVALHPQADLATEPRWSRGTGTFGSDADAVGGMVAAYVRGLQGTTLGSTSVAAMVKHFPGAGPQLRGDDAHFPYGREQVYPGHNAEYHLGPFIQAIEAGAAEIMPYYALPVGLGVEEIGFGFNREIVTGWLRERLGFDGIVCSDWGLVTDVRIGGTRWPARCWGAEDLDRHERVARILDAGCDQMGGEFSPELVVDLVERGRITEDRIDASLRRILAVKFELGLFENPYVNPERAEELVGCEDFRRRGEEAQARALAVVTNPGPILPLATGIRVRLEGVDAAAAEGRVVADSEADLVIRRINAPWEKRDTGVDYEAGFHQGSLAFTPEEDDALVADLERTPTILVVRMDRPAILTRIVPAAAAVIADFGVGDEALMSVLMGERIAGGRLPMDLPSSMAEVEASSEDVPDDTANPLFRRGHAASPATPSR